MKYTVVLPYVYEPYKEECLKTCKFEDILLVDNTHENRGIMQSHNMGIDKMHEDDSDWLICMSAAVRFGVFGGLDFIEELKNRPDDHVVEATNVNGWHLIAFSRKVIDTVGRWDENFTPYGYDDLDYSWRIRLAFGDSIRWQKAITGVIDMGMAHGIKLAGVDPDNLRLRLYYRTKWGITPESDHEKAYKRPFGSEANPVGYWPPFNGRGCGV